MEKRGAVPCQLAVEYVDKSQVKIMRVALFVKIGVV